MEHFSRYVIQAFWVLFFYLLGMGVSFLTAGFLPGSVTGMVLLYFTLELGWLKAEKVRDVSNFLMRYMVLFFVPPAIAIMTVWSRVQSQITAILVAMTISTIAVIGTVAITQQIIENRRKK